MASTGGKKRSFAEVRASAKPLVKTERLCLDGTLADEFERLAADLEHAKRRDEHSNEPDEAPAIRLRLDELVVEIAEAEQEFTFQAIGRPAWRELATEHPPTKEQQDAGNDVNGDTFRLAAMAASCIEPGDATVEDFEDLERTLTEGQWERLWQTCRAANMGSGDLPNFIAAYGAARPSETS